MRPRTTRCFEGMKELLLPLTSAVFICTGCISHAGLIWYDSFDYASGSVISAAGSPNWYFYGGNLNTDPEVTGGSLSYPALQTNPAGNSVLFNGTASAIIGIAMRALGGVYNSGTVYYSLTLRVATISTGDWGGSGNWLTGSYMLGLDQEAIGSLAQGDVAAPLLIRTGDPDNTSGAANDYQGFQLGTGVTADSATRAFDAAHTYAPGTTLFLVLAYTFVNGANNDVAKLYVNPAPGSPESANPPVVTVTGVADVTSNRVQTVFLRNNSVEPAGTLVDDLRVGTTWAEVTPSSQAISPTLGILPAGTNVQLRWPVNRRGFVLEESTNLGPSVVWTIASNNVSVSSNDFIASPTAGSRDRFFRLRQLFAPGLQVENIQVGFDATAPALTDALRLSGRTGVNWWSMNTPRFNPEDGAALPYAFHDGYVEWIGAANSPTRTPAEAALRWYMILNGQGDPWTGASAASIGHPAIILLDEVTTDFKDTLQGPALQEALWIYITQYGGSRDDIVAYLQRSASLTATPNLYNNLIYCANNYLRFLALEVYCSHQGFITGTDGDGNNIGLTDDAYLASRLAMPFKRWADAGVAPLRLVPILSPSNFASYPGYAKSFNKFLNRQFWFLANGWYNSAHSGVDPNIKTALRNGVGTYKWSPGTTVWTLLTTETSRDDAFEAYLHWYCVDGHLDAHPDGVDSR